MPTFQHPASLNVLQQFGQASSILRHTTRASNPAWYQDALELNLQLHLRADGAGITAFYYDHRGSQWSPGPVLSEEILHDPARLDATIVEALRDARTRGANSLGVVLHIADEFATTELKPELDNPAALPELRDAAVFNPGSILGDTSIFADQASWRVIPYPAANGTVIGSTVTVSKNHDSLLTKFREAGEQANFPIITHALSAPLVAIMGLQHSITPSPAKPFVAILQYPWFTVLAFFNEHSDLRLIRTLQHRGLPRPGNFRNALATTNASLEFVDPDLFLVRLGATVDTTWDADLRRAFTACRVEVIQPSPVAGIPDWCSEPAIAVAPASAAGSGINSHTFAILSEEKWALQNFLPVPREIAEIYPSRSEMRLLKICRLARVAVVGVAVLCIAYFFFGAIDLVRRPEWAFDPSQAEMTKVRLAKVTLEQKKAEHWGNLLQDRSKAWTSMESLSRLFPENRGMLVKSYSHAAKPENAPTKGNTTVGFVKEWKITGYARDEALDYLNNINTREGISAHFSEVARITGNESFNPAVGTRSLVVNVRTQENGGYKPIPPEEARDADESTYPFTFDLTLTQRFEATDPMALTISKAP
ncbi:hypothetical protein HQ447_08495 [bacterium]|nr:hypothetical protein [bacterium]